MTSDEYVVKRLLETESELEKVKYLAEMNAGTIENLKSKIEELQNVIDCIGYDAKICRSFNEEPYIHIGSIYEDDERYPLVYKALFGDE